jgi:2-methylcitrate dehydratase PrpD
LFAAFRREPAPESIALFADGRPEILSVYSKPVPACNFAQTACQAAARVAGRLGDDLGCVRTILVRLPAAAIRYPGCDSIGPFQRALQAKMSIPFGVAATLRRRTIAEENYDDLGEAGILRLISLTRLEEDDALTQRFPAAQGAEVRVSLADGSLVMERLDDVVAATSAEIRARFRAAAASVLGPRRAAEIEACVDGLEDEADAGRVAALCATSSSGAAVRPRRAQSQAGRSAP